MNYEELQIQACKDGIEIIEYPFKSSNIKGLYCNGTVALNEDMTQVEKSCVLARKSVIIAPAPVTFWIKLISCTANRNIAHGSMDITSKLVYPA